MIQLVVEVPRYQLGKESTECGCLLGRLDHSSIATGDSGDLCAAWYQQTTPYKGGVKVSSYQRREREEQGEVECSNDEDDALWLGFKPRAHHEEVEVEGGLLTLGPLPNIVVGVAYVHVQAHEVEAGSGDDEGA